MVQVLPAVPSFGDKLAQVLGEAGVNIAEGFQQRSVNKKDQTILDQISEGISSGKMSPVQAIIASQGLSKDKRKDFSAGYGPIAKEQVKVSKEQAKVSAATAEKDAAKQELVPAFKRLRELVPYGGKFGVKSVMGKIPFTEAAGKREELDTLGVWAADSVYTKFNKGTLSEVKWDDVKSRFAPHSGLSDVENEARINAMETIIGLPADISADKMESVIKSQEKMIESAEKKSSGKYKFKQNERPAMGSFWK